MVGYGVHRTGGDPVLRTTLIVLALSSAALAAPRVVLLDADVEGLPAIASQRIPELVGQALRTRTCAEPMFQKELGERGGADVRDCLERGACLADIGARFEATRVLQMRARLEGPVVELVLIPIDVATRRVVTSRTVRYSGGLGSLRERLLPDERLCGIVVGDAGDELALALSEPEADDAEGDLPLAMPAAELPLPPLDALPDIPAPAVVVAAPPALPAAAPVVVAAAVPAPPAPAVVTPEPVLPAAPVVAVTTPPAVRTPPTKMLPPGALAAVDPKKSVTPNAPATSIRSWLVWGGLGIAGAAAGTGLGFGAGALSSVEDRRMTNDLTSFRNAQSSAETRATLANVFFGVAAAAGLTSAGAWLFAE